MQRFFDILLSSTALILLSPFLAILIVFLKFTGEGEVFFLQNRVGFEGNNFKLYKFATMLKNSQNLGTGTITTFNDPRVLPLGRFLRKTKINEIPQLFNIFKGEMSLIGPRPQTQRCFNAFPDSLKKQIVRVRPGLSGIGSIIFRNEENMILSNSSTDEFYDDVIMPYKGKLEEWFVYNSSLRNYFLLIIFSIFILFKKSTLFIFKYYSSVPRPPERLNSFIPSDYYE